MELAAKHKDQLRRIKNIIKDQQEYWQPNVQRYHMFRRFVYDTSLNEGDKAVLNALNKPELEFNILEAYLSRLCGEFSKQIPSVEVRADDGAPVDPAVLDIVEGHIRHILDDANRSGCEYNSYRDSLSGGFSALKVWTEYAHPMSFNQVIKLGRIFDPTLCGFDPLAKEPSKCDGRFCFELYPKSKIEFEEEYPEVALDGIAFSREFDGFNWSYSNSKQEILLVCDYYEKKRKRKKIVKLVTGHVMTMDEYKEFLEHWETLGRIEQPPAIQGAPRWTEIETICRYRLIENQVLEYKETNYKYLPLVFVDGNSIDIRHSINNNYTQMTRPYVYHAKGVQKLKNFAGQTLANALENMVQHKFKVAKESIPDEQPYRDAYSNIQLANTLVYKAFKDNDPNVPVPPPMEIQQVPAPPEVTATFGMTDQITQAILGSYDASLGINDNQLSGVAIQEGATQSNAAAMPYVVGYMHALNQVAEIIVDLIPKYYVTPRTIPVVSHDGEMNYRMVNGAQQPNQQPLFLNYDENALQVKVKAGVNFAIQKSRSLSQIITMSQASPVFGQFMNDKGLKILLDNFEIQGVDQLKVMAEQWMQEQAQMKQQQQQMAEQQMQNNPMMIKAQNERMKIQMDAQQSQVENQIKGAELELKKQEVDQDMIKILTDAKAAETNAAVMMDKADAEKSRAAVDLAMKTLTMYHTQDHDLAKLTHEVMKSSREHHAKMAQIHKPKGE